MNGTWWPVFLAAALLVGSNLFMTFAWYGHLKHLNDRVWIVAALISWGIALFEYLLQVARDADRSRRQQPEATAAPAKRRRRRRRSSGARSEGGATSEPAASSS